MPKRKRERLFIGISGKAVALDVETGAEIWRTKLKGSGTVLLHRTGSALYASVSGELFCLDPDSGGIRWHNKLKGLGFGLVSMATTAEDAEQSSAYVPIAEALRQQAARHASAGAAG
jgi:outer membrane protein assembly factor BamB